MAHARTHLQDPGTHRDADAGFALVDALVALLLLAVVLLASMAALLKGMHATHGAVLTGRAVDLAADLLEQHRADATPVEALLPAWHARVAAQLPESTRVTANALAQPLVDGGLQ
jgi:Tfp pilus assembly protein PilV